MCLDSNLAAMILLVVLIEGGKKNLIGPKMQKLLKCPHYSEHTFNLLKLR